MLMRRCIFLMTPPHIHPDSKIENVDIYNTFKKKNKFFLFPQIILVF